MAARDLVMMRDVLDMIDGYVFKCQEMKGAVYYKSGLLVQKGQEGQQGPDLDRMRREGIKAHACITSL